VFVALLTKLHRVKSNGTLADFLAPLQRKAAALSFPELLDAVNKELDPKINFSAAYRSLQAARNCFEHRAGVVSKIETHGKDRFSLCIPRMKMFYLRDGQEVELEFGNVVDPGGNQTEVQVFWKIDTKERSFSIGERLTFTPAEFNEITFACYYLGQQLSSRLAKPKIKSDEQGEVKQMSK
jgi:hypothetical protein